MRVDVTDVTGKDAPGVFVCENVKGSAYGDSLVRERATSPELYDHCAARLVVPPRLDGFAFYVVQGNRAAHS